jgi:two-component system OmpR family sensor kinase
MKSLQKTVMLYVTILLVVVGVTAAIVSYFFVKGEVNSFQDNALQEVALNAGLVYRHDIQPRIDAELEDQLVVQIWDHSERPLHRSGPPVDIPAQADLGYSDVTAGGERWRVFRARDSRHVIQISQRWSAREEVASYAAAGAVIPLIASIPLAWLLIGWVVKRVLAGLGDLSADIGRRSADAKGALRLTGVPAEIVPLVGAMNSLIERQQQALETQRRFVSDAAHELRTPLAALQIQIDNMRAQDITGGAREIADDLLDGIRRATYLVNQLLLLARADASMESDLESIQAGVLIQMVAAPLASIAEARGLRLVTDIEENISVTVRASEVQLVLSNLLDNAIRYTRNGGLVRIEAKRVADNLEIELTDTGCGIPEAALPRLYERFFRAAPLDIEGTGLGLAIARTAADRNGLRMEIRNRADVQGVVARLTIPIGVPEYLPA